MTEIPNAPLLESVRPRERAPVALLSGLKLGPYEIQSPWWAAGRDLSHPVFLPRNVFAPLRSDNSSAYAGSCRGLDRARGGHSMHVGMARDRT